MHVPSSQCWNEPCIECGKFYSIIYLVADSERNIWINEGCMQEVFMCPSCFNFFFATNPSKRGGNIIEI